MAPFLPCPLCSSETTAACFEAHGRRFLGCSPCGLLFLHPADRLGPEAERARYETHENDPEDPRYRAFLSRVTRPLMAALPPGAEGLDFGSGPGPTLSRIMEEGGFPAHIHDPFFAPAPHLLEGAERYDWITCTETAEHLFHPGAVFASFHRLLRPGGILGVMTEVVPGEEDDPPPLAWYYLRDPTHVVLYRERTLGWIARAHGWSMDRVEPRVTLFRKPREGAAQGH